MEGGGSSGGGGATPTVSLKKKVSGVSLPYLHAFNPTEKYIVDFLEQALSIFNTLLQFHYFLQHFAIDRSKVRCVGGGGGEK